MVSIARILKTKQQNLIHSKETTKNKDFLNMVVKYFYSEGKCSNLS